MPTRSTVLFRYVTLANANTVVYTVPTGITVIIKTVTSNNRSGGQARVVVSTSHPDPFVQCDVMNISQPAAFEPTIVQTWHVVMPGDQVIVYSDRSGVDLWCSAAVLPGVQQP